MTFGAGVSTVNSSGALVPPPGAPVLTVTPRTPASVTRFFGSGATSSVSDANVVAAHAVTREAHATVAYARDAGPRPAWVV